MFMCSLIVLALAGLLWCIYKRADDAFISFEPLYTDVAMMESALHTLQQQVQEAQADLRRLRSAQAELSGEIEMVSDSAENLQWGVITTGGYANFNALTPSQRQRMYAMERSNMIASRTMGMQRYMEHRETPEPRCYSWSGQHGHGPGGGKIRGGGIE